MSFGDRAYDVPAIETRWREAWRRADCFSAPQSPGRDRYFNYDSGPFPSGDLHLGHVRTYALGDMTARFQRLRGRSVLYCTEWDAFGLPAELAAEQAGVAPPEYTRACIAQMESQLRRLGVSYDWERVRSTSDPRYHRWTQWLFLELLHAGLIERRSGPRPFCPRCATTLARMQVHDGQCWRCGSTVQERSVPQWTVLLSRYAKRLEDGLAALEGWSGTARKLQRGLAGRRMLDDGDWVVSRQRSWGTPIPIVHCDDCGAVPVSTRDLPIALPDDLRWSAPPHPLRHHEGFVRASCPRCGGAARRETDTLDCHFDDMWCQLAAAAPSIDALEFRAQDFAAWMPVDRFHSGHDTFFYLHLHRFLAHFLADEGRLDDEEPIRSHHGHEMVLSGGRKMSKHSGNAVSVAELLDDHGADALRLAILWAANPDRPIDFDPTLLGKAAALLDAIHRLFDDARRGRVVRPSGPQQRPGVSRATARLRDRVGRAVTRMAELIEGYRPCGALEAYATAIEATRAFTEARLPSDRLSPAERDVLAGVLGDLSIALSPFAPHLAEECWSMLGGPDLVAQARWPATGGP